MSESEIKSAPFWEHFSHEADIGVRGWGRTLEEAFEQVALALIAVISDIKLIKAQQHVPITCQAPDKELLLVDWLNALIYAMATQKLLFHHFKVRIHGDVLEGEAWGEPIDRLRHCPAVEPKGATFTALSVAQIKGQWCVQCVVDV